MTGDTEFPAPDRGTLIAATAVVAATWFYFLVFVHQGLTGLGLEWSETQTWQERGLLTWLGTGGMLGSFLAAWRFNIYRWRGQLSWSLRACAMIAAGATMAGVWEALATFAALSGLSLGWLTVTLATGLRPSVGTTRLGWVIGLGTGIAFAGANLPVVVEAEPARQAILAAVVIAAVSILAPFLTPQEPSVSSESVYGVRGVVGWILLMAPVCAVTAAMVHRIESGSAVGELLRTGTGWLLALGAVHVIAGMAAGRLLDRGWRWRLWLVGAVLVLGGAALAHPDWRLFLIWGFAGGVSVVSATLLYYVARGGRAWSAACVLVLTGWLGTAVGLGHVMDNERPPADLLPVVLAGAVCGSLLFGWAYRQPLKTTPKTAD